MHHTLATACADVVLCCETSPMPHSSTMLPYRVALLRACAACTIAFKVGLEFDVPGAVYEGTPYSLGLRKACRDETQSLVCSVVVWMVTIL